METESNGQTPVRLSDDEKAALEAGVKSEKADRHYSLDEVVEFANRRLKEWKNTKPNRSA